MQENLKEQIKDRMWYHMAENELVDLLKTDVSKGLTTQEAEKRLAEFGPNMLAAKKGKNPFIMFLLQFHQPLIYILIASGCVTFFLEEYVDSAVIFGVVFLNAVIGFVQEIKAVRALDALAKSVVTEAKVLRDGRLVTMPSANLVPGDVVLLQAGDKVPADMRLIGGRSPRIDESVLTGESVPVEKEFDVLPENIILAERKNMAFTSTLATYGQSNGIVVTTGTNTEIGHISQQLDSAEELETPLTAKIEKFSTKLMYMILGLALVTFAAGMYHDFPFSKSFVAAVALAVAAVPEGLPAAFTIILAIGVSRMVKRRAIVRKLPAVETLGSTTVICSDKTGTLTENQMTVQHLYVAKKEFSVSGSGYAPEGEVTDENGQKVSLAVLEECFRAGILCNDAALENKNGQWLINGDPTEGGLIVSARKYGLNEEDENKKYERISLIPFESEYQYMATLNKCDDAKNVVYMKGAAEILIGRCVNMMDENGSLVPMDVSSVRSEVEKMASKGMRILAFIRKEVPVDTTSVDHDDVKDNMTFLGLQMMIDPPRREATIAVANCLSAGVRVKMITGDHALTASAIARQMKLDGLDTDELPAVMTGEELGKKSDEELEQIVQDISVFARVTPEQKLKLVRALQKRNEIVAMTGDGVNDAPALKQSNIGVAMGKNGTDVAKDAADIILMDDNFATIEAAVEEGRCVFDNLMKFIIWTLPVSFGESFVLLAAIFAGTELPVSSLQILWINLAQTVFLGFAFAFENKEKNIMVRSPRRPDAPIVPLAFMYRMLLVSVIMVVTCFYMFFKVYDNNPDNLALAQTTVVNVIVFIQIFYMFNCRSLLNGFWTMGLFANKVFWGGIILMVLAQLTFTYTPLFNLMFKTAPIPCATWLYIVGVGFASSLLVGLYKKLYEAKVEKKSFL